MVLVTAAGQVYAAETAAHLTAANAPLSAFRRVPLLHGVRQVRDGLGFARQRESVPPRVHLRARCPPCAPVRVRVRVRVAGPASLSP